MLAPKLGLRRDGHCVLIRYLSWCLPGPHVLQVRLPALRLREERACNAKRIAKLSLRLWMAARSPAPTEMQRFADEAKSLTNNLFDSRLNQQEYRATSEATDDEVQPFIDSFMKAFLSGGILVPYLLRWAAVRLSGRPPATPEQIGKGLCRPFGSRRVPR